MEITEINRGYLKPKKLTFPGDEKLHPWLPMLLEAYYIVDKGIAEAIEKEIKSGRKLACAKGCSSCCKTHKDIPVYPLELVGISWYVTEKFFVKLMQTCNWKSLSDRMEEFDIRGVFYETEL